MVRDPEILHIVWMLRLVRLDVNVPSLQVQMVRCPQDVPVTGILLCMENVDVFSVTVVMCRIATNRDETWRNTTSVVPLEFQD